MPELAIVVIVLSLLIIPAWLWDRVSPDADLGDDGPEWTPLYRQPARQGRPVGRMPWNR